MVDYLVGVAAVHGIPPTQARECPLRDLEILTVLTGEVHGGAE